MNQITKALFFIAIFMSGQSYCQAQTVSELIKQALEKNYQIRILNNDLQIAENNNTPGNAGQLPSVDFSGTASNSLNNTRQQFSDGSVRQGNNARSTNINLSLLANWTVFDGFSIQAKKDQLEQLVSLGKYNTEFYIEQTVSDIVAAYYQIVYQRQLLTSYKSSMAISAYRYELEKKRKEVGAGDAKILGQAFVDYQTDSMTWLRQNNIIEALEIELNRLVNNNVQQKIQIATDDFNLNELDNEANLLQTVRTKNVQLDQALIRSMIAETQLRIERAKQLPTVNLYGGYQVARSSAAVGFITSNSNIGPVVGITVNYNLFNGWKTKGEIRNAEITLENKQLTKDDTQLQLSAEVLKLYKEYSALKKQLALARENKYTMEKVYNITAVQLKQGSINGYDFRQTQVTLLIAEQTELQILYALKTIEINIDQLSGNIVERYLK